MKIEIVDHVNSPGKQDGASEDRYGWNDTCVFVIDGASGLSDRQLMTDFSSDAAWLAELAVRHFTNTSDEPVADSVRKLNDDARVQWFAHPEAQDMPRYTWPAAAFQMLRIEGTYLRSYGLGDCRLFLQSEEDGRIFETTALKGNRDREIAAARAHLDRTGGFSDGNDMRKDATTLAALRAGRSKHNTAAGNIFTLGLVPEAADRTVREETGICPPVRGLLCSDGFAALVDNYDAFSPENLIAAAFDHGLPALVKHLRHIECDLDPQGQIYPRYKVSDDATCVAFRIF